MAQRQKPKSTGHKHEPEPKRRKRFVAVQTGNFGGRRNEEAKLTASQKYARAKMARDLKTGAVSLPPNVCEHCFSPSLTANQEFRDVLDCITCGKSSSKREVTLRRRARIVRMIEDAGREVTDA